MGGVYTKKRDRVGRKFGFVGFLNVKELKTLEKKLDQILIRNMKMHVS